MNQEIRLADEPEEKKDRTPVHFFILGVSMLILLFVCGSVSEDADFQMVLVVISLFFIVLSILWGIRKKIASVVISFGILFAIYFLASIVAWFFMDLAYSWGIMTFIIIGAFVFWLSSDRVITWDDGGKAILFVIITFIANSSGWLTRVDDLIATFSGGIPI